MPERFSRLNEHFIAHPEALRNVAGKIQSSPKWLRFAADRRIDTALGMPPQASQSQQPTDLQREILRADYGDEAFLYVGTPYTFIKHLIKQLDPQSTDVVYDLGTGFGRFPLWGALTTPAKYKGIEIVQERVAKAQEIAGRFKIDNVSFLHGNVLDFDLSDGTIFYMYDPFTKETLSRVKEKLRAIAGQKTIQVGWFSSWEFNYDCDWLKKTHEFPLLKIYKSD